MAEIGRRLQIVAGLHRGEDASAEIGHTFILAGGVVRRDWAPDQVQHRVLDTAGRRIVQLRPASVVELGDIGRDCEGDDAEGDEHRSGRQTGAGKRVGSDEEDQQGAGEYVARGVGGAAADCDQGPVGDGDGEEDPERTRHAAAKDPPGQRNHRQDRQGHTPAGHPDERRKDTHAGRVDAEDRAGDCSEGIDRRFRDQPDVGELDRRVIELRCPKPPATIEGDWNEEDPEPPPAIRAEQHRDCDADGKGKPELDHRDREDQEDAGEDVSAPVATLQDEQRSQAQGERVDRVQVEGPEKRLPGVAEEEQRDTGHQRDQRSDPAPGELEEERDGGQHPGDIEGSEDRVVGAEDFEDTPVEQLAEDL